MQGPPPNVVANATICEEARLNPAARHFVSAKGYEIRPGQTKAAKKGTDIEFTAPAVEVKVDWIPASDFNPPFTCSQPPSGVHVETIDGTCYAMAGMHLSSKLLKDWLWATFEPQSMLTNPLRCITFGPCNDLGIHTGHQQWRRRRFHQPDFRPFCLGETSQAGPGVLQLPPGWRPD